MLSQLLSELSDILNARRRRLRLGLDAGAAREIRVGVGTKQRESLVETNEADRAAECGNGDRQRTTLLLLRLGLRMLQEMRGLLLLRRRGLHWNLMRLLRRVLLLLLWLLLRLLLLRLLWLRLLLRLLGRRGGRRCEGR